MSKIKDLIPLIKEALDNNQEFILPINGTSMQPFLRNNDYVYLTIPNNLKHNDIILYQRNEEEFVLHRIVKQKDNYYVLMGDHQLIEEFPIYKEQVVAKVTKVRKNNKELSLKGIKYNLYLFFIKFKLFRKLLLKLGK